MSFVRDYERPRHGRVEVQVIERCRGCAAFNKGILEFEMSTAYYISIPSSCKHHASTEN